MDTVDAAVFSHIFTLQKSNPLSVFPKIGTENKHFIQSRGSCDVMSASRNSISSNFHISLHLFYSLHQALFDKQGANNKTTILKTTDGKVSPISWVSLLPLCLLKWGTSICKSALNCHAHILKSVQSQCMRNSPSLSLLNRRSGRLT